MNLNLLNAPHPMRVWHRVSGMPVPKLRSTVPVYASSAHRPSRTPTLTVVSLNPVRPCPPDDAWVSSLTAVARHQDRAAFARLFTHFAPRVKRYLMLGGSPEAQAEVLAQETMAMVWRKAELFDAGKAGVTTWVFTIARNLRVELHRKRFNQDVFEDDFDFGTLEAKQPTLEDLMHAARLQERLGAALAQLSPDQLEVIRMAYGADESQSEIAASLGLPLGTVKSRVRAALALLRRLIEG